MVLTIGGLDCTGYLVPESLSLEDAINERSILSFALKAPQGTLRVVEGQQVMLTNVDRIFGGTIESVTEEQPIGSTYVLYRVECVDWHQVLDRRIVAESYADTTVGDIIADIVTTYLAAEEITHSVTNATVVREAVFNYVPATQVFDRLAERTGCNWWIDPDKVLHFEARDATAAPWSISSTSPIRNVQVQRHRQEYRNRQYVKGGRATTDTQTESFKGDGVTQTFNVGYPIAKQPTITLNGTPQTVGVRGVDSGKQWYYAKGDRAITQDPDGTPIGPDDALVVTYQGLFNIVLILKDEAAIAERQAVEGGTGCYDYVDEEPEITSLDAAIEYASDKLRRYARTGRTLTFTTFRDGLAAGQILHVDLPEHGLDEDFLITRVEFAETEADGKYEWAVEAVSGEAVGGWAQFFRKLAGAGKVLVFRENISEEEVLVIVVEVPAESWSWGEATSVAVYACPVPSSTLYPSSDLYPC